ncbi:MAG: glycosyltransferase family 2 protein [Oscillospiraceae bacterium]
MSIPVSVIIPAYNCANLVGDTIRSLQEQSLADFEVIIVNDGSKDNTLEVLETFQKADSRIQVITVANAGPANARNVGIKQARGEYLAFLDSDDLIDKDMLWDMYRLAHDKDLDEVCCGYNMENISTKTPHIKAFAHESFVALNKEEFGAQLMSLIKAHLMYVVWNKLFKTEFIKENQISFEDFMSGEDRLFNIHTFQHITRFGCIDKPYYRYFLRGQQTLANRYVKNRFDASLKCHIELIDSYKAMGLYNEQNRAYIDFAFIKSVVSCFTQLNSKGCDMTFTMKKDYIAEVLQNEYVKSALRASDDEIGYSKIINAILRSNHKSLIYLTAKGIFLMQFKFNAIYLNLKHKVKKG